MFLRRRYAESTYCVSLADLSAGWLVPQRVRSEWRVRWDSMLFNLWILSERGELNTSASEEFARLCRRAFSDALEVRFTRIHLTDWLRGPGFVLTCAVFLLFLISVFSRGFAVTRSLIDTARAIYQGVPHTSGDALMAYLGPVAFAIFTGVLGVAVGRLSLQNHGWRYWMFLGLKLLSITLILPLLWIEGGAALRRPFSHRELGIVIAGIVPAILLVGGFGAALIWCLADQRKRCPVCLRRLTMPVTIGSMGSVFEPVTTELLCEEGHGLMCVSETFEGEQRPLDHAGSFVEYAIRTRAIKIGNRNRGGSGGDAARGTRRTEGPHDSHARCRDSNGSSH